MTQLLRQASYVLRAAVLLLGVALLPACAWLGQKTSESPEQVTASQQSAEIAAAFRKRVQPTLEREQQRAAPAKSSLAASMTPPPVRASASAGLASGAGNISQVYRIGVGDRVRIDVRGEPDLSVEFAVGQTGSVSYPFLGEVIVAGQTVDQVQSRIDRGLRNGYLVNPDVRVLITEYRKFYVNGEVRIPGGYSFIAGLTVRQAAALAGGFTERASMNKITVYREAAPTLAETANLDTAVFPGDTVVVAQGLF